ncbi:MAG: two-component system phosphate regulon sensor histidine kinase PhoR, partial [Ulvibacter sp.]
VGGSGLGLSIVKHIIDAHNERIYVESQIGIGSEFSFTLEKAK